LWLRGQFAGRLILAMFISPLNGKVNETGSISIFTGRRGLTPGLDNRATKDNPLNDSDRPALAVSQIVGKRLTYAELTGKTAEEPF